MQFTNEVTYNETLFTFSKMNLLLFAINFTLIMCIVGLPPSGSWQDLKDHMREAGDVCYADVYRDGSGVVEYLKYDDMKYALRKLDDTKFKSHEVDRFAFSGIFAGSLARRYFQCVREYMQYPWFSCIGTVLQVN